MHSRSHRILVGALVAALGASFATGGPAFAAYKRGTGTKWNKRIIIGTILGTAVAGPIAWVVGGATWLAKNARAAGEFVYEKGSVASEKVDQAAHNGYHKFSSGISNGVKGAASGFKNGIKSATGRGGGGGGNGGKGAIREGLEGGGGGLTPVPVQTTSGKSVTVYGDPATGRIYADQAGTQDITDQIGGGPKKQ